MSLHQKIIMHNIANMGKGIENASLLHLENVEPTKSESSSKVSKWVNKKLSNEFLTPLIERKLIYANIEKQNILIDSASDFANLIEVPAGQLLYLLYERKNSNYKTFTIDKKIVRNE